MGWLTPASLGTACPGEVVLDEGRPQGTCPKPEGPKLAAPWARAGGGLSADAPWEPQGRDRRRRGAPVLALTTQHPLSAYSRLYLPLPGPTSGGGPSSQQLPAKKPWWRVGGGCGSARLSPRAWSVLFLGLGSALPRGVSSLACVRWTPVCLHDMGLAWPAVLLVAGSAHRAACHDTDPRSDPVTVPGTSTGHPGVALATPVSGPFLQLGLLGNPQGPRATARWRPHWPLWLVHGETWV